MYILLYLTHTHWWWTILKLYSWSFSIHLANCPSGCLKFDGQVSELWSVLTVNLYLRRNGQKWQINVTTLHSFLQITQYHLSGFLRVLLARSVTFSPPLSSVWDSTIPIPVSLKSVSRANGLLKSGKANTGAVVKHCFKSSNAFWHCRIHWKGVVFSVRWCSGLATVAKPLMN